MFPFKSNPFQIPKKLLVSILPLFCAAALFSSSLHAQTRGKRKAGPKAPECHFGAGGFTFALPGLKQNLKVYEDHTSNIAAQLSNDLHLEFRTFCKPTYYFNSGFGISSDNNFVLAAHSQQALNISEDPNNVHKFAFLSDAYSSGITQLEFSKSWTFLYDFRSKFPIRVYTSFIIALTHDIGDIYLTHATNRTAACATAVADYIAYLGYFPDETAIQNNCEHAKINETYFTSYLEQGVFWSSEDYNFSIHLYNKSRTMQLVENRFKLTSEAGSYLSIMYSETF